MTGRLFGTVLSLETRKLMSYRVDFWVTAVVSFGAELAVAYFLWRAIFAAGGNSTSGGADAVRIGGWSFEGMVLYYVFALLLGRLIRGQERGEPMALDIYDGGLTRYLIYPSSYVAFKYAAHLGTLLPSALQLAVFGTATMLWIDLPPEVVITPTSVAMAAATVLVGNLLAFALRYPLAGIAFWADNVWSLQAMVRFTTELLGGLLLPLSLFPAWGQKILGALPFPYLFYIPVQTLFGQRSVLAWATGLGIAFGWCLALMLLGHWVWSRGYRRYTGVGI